MAKLVKFLRGLDASYSYKLASPTTAHEGAIYFATDSGLIYVNGKVYGGDNVVKVKDVEVINEYVLKLTYSDGSTKEIDVLNILPVATETSKGLLSAEDKVFIDELAAEREAGMAFISPDQAATIADVKNGKYAEKEYVDTELGKKVDVTTYEAYVASNDAAVKKVGDDLAAEILRATAAEGANADAIAVEKNRVDILVGEDADMSARAIVQDEVAKQLESESITDSFDTLREMAEYLSSHPKTVTEMNEAISANAGAITALQGQVGEGTVDSRIEAAETDLIGTEGDAADANTIYGAKKYATEAVAAHELTVSIALDGKVDKIEGKGLSTNDYTDAEKERLASIKVVDVDTTAVNGISLKLNTEKVAVGTVDTAALADALVATDLTGLKVKLGQTISNTELTATNNVTEAIETLSVKIKALADAKVETIVGDNYISVDSANVTKPALSLSIKAVGNALVDNTSAIKANAETGLITLEWEEIQ